jgi:hypothetical protein
MPEVGNIQKFVQEVVATTEGCDAKTEEISDLTNDLDEQEKELEKIISEIRTDASKFNTDFEADHSETVSGLQEFIALLEKLAGEGIGDFLKTFDDIDDATDKAADKHKSDLDSSFQDLENDGFKHLEEGIEHCEGTVSDQERESKQSFDDYESHVDEQKNITTTFKEATATIFGSVVENLTDSLTSEVSSGFDSFTSGLTSGLGDITKGISDVGGLLTEGFNLFDKGADDLGQHLMEMAGNVITDTMSHMSDTLMQGLEDMFKHLCEQVFQELVSEFVEQMAVMTIGQTITTACGPYSGVIVAANVVLSIIEKLLSLLGM